MKNKLYYCLFLLCFGLLACEEEEPELGVPAEASFEVFPIADDPNRVLLVASSGDTPSLKMWKLGNGASPEGDSVIAYYPFKGEYEIIFTAYSQGGAAKAVKTISIAETDPEICENEVLTLLTGGCEVPAGKTWVVDAGSAGHFGLGPKDAESPVWYATKPNEKAGGGLYNDFYTFKLEGYEVDIETNGDVYLNSGQAANFAGSYPSPVGDHMAPYEAPEGLTYTLEEEDGKLFLIINNGGFIGYYSGVTRYQILNIEENVLFLKQFDTANPDFAWFLRLIPEGTTPPPPPPPSTSSLPIDFEGAAPPFNGFGGTVYEVVDNPDATGINTSAKVGKYVKGTEGSWAGIETVLESPLDFSTNNLIKYDVYSPVAGRALFKLEDTDGGAEPVEVFADVTKVNEWEELTFDFSGVPADTYEKVAMFLDFDNNNGGTFYVDNIHQPSTDPGMSLEEKDIAVDFDGNSTITEEQWYLEQVSGYEFPVANPETDAVNPSANVFRYDRGSGQYENIQIHLNHKIDLTNRNQFSILVYFPSANDYSGSLAKTFAVKLQNRELGGEAWTTQVEKKPAVEVLDEWVKLTYDFSEVADREDFDTIVLQPGGEAHTAAGTFYFDEFQLLPAE